MRKKYDFLIIGSGLYGATFAHIMKMHNKRCLVIERRSHLGGNIFCENVENIPVHKYGAHIFHTSDKKVWDFVNSLCSFNRYTNCPIAMAPDGRYYNLPFNMNTFYTLWNVKTPQDALNKLEKQREDAVKSLKGRHPANLEEQALSLVGKDIYELLIKGYTEKQWGRKCSDLPADIIKRIPVRLTFDNNYFNDAFQGIPIGGYNYLINALLEGVEVRTKCDFFEHRNDLEMLADTIVYTGAIDRFFDYIHGHLQYRTVSFETETLETANFQGNAVINYTSVNIPFTRIIEHKHFEMFGDQVYDIPVSVISREFSAEWNPKLEPYYPINDERNLSLFCKYHNMALELNKMSVKDINYFGPNEWIFGGRLAEYKYYDMDKVVAEAMKRAYLKLSSSC